MSAAVILRGSMNFCDNTHLHTLGVNLEAQIGLRLVPNPTPRPGDKGNGSHDGLASKPASKQLQVGRACRGKGPLKAPAGKQDRHRNLVLAAPQCLGCDLHWVTFAEPKEPYMSEACADCQSPPSPSLPDRESGEGSHVIILTSDQSLLVSETRFIPLRSAHVLTTSTDPCGSSFSRTPSTSMPSNLVLLHTGSCSLASHPARRHTSID